MNKIYSDMLSKARTFSESVSKNADELEKKNIRIDCGRIDNLSLRLEEAALRQEEAEQALFAARDKAHELLDELKACYSDSKAPIKSNYTVESWARFGLADRR